MKITVDTIVHLEEDSLSVQLANAKSLLENHGYSVYSKEKDYYIPNQILEYSFTIPDYILTHGEDKEIEHFMSKEMTYSMAAKIIELDFAFPRKQKREKIDYYEGRMHYTGKIGVFDARLLEGKEKQIFSHLFGQNIKRGI